jgi:hypothetical protein
MTFLPSFLSEKVGGPIKPISIYTTELYPALTHELIAQCTNQDWDMLEIREGLPEGRGVFLKRGNVQRGIVLCNYGGHLLTYKKGMEMYDNPDFGNYLLQFKFEEKKFFLVHTVGSPDTFGKLINHSQIHPNVTPKVFKNKEGEPEVMFLALKQIAHGEELVYNYGDKFVGVQECITSCKQCYEEDCSELLSLVVKLNWSLVDRNVSWWSFSFKRRYK